MSGGVWHIRLAAGPDAADAYEAALASLVDAVTSRRDPDDSRMPVTLEGFAGTAPDPAALAAALAVAEARAGAPATLLAAGLLPDTDWVAQGRRAMAPVRAGRFTVHDSDHRGTVPSGGIGIEVDAGLAFGSGHHETTRGCLLALDALARSRDCRRPLDMGCGSGVLAIAMARLWRVPVRAVDCDPVAVAVTAQNARRNRVAAWLRPAVGDRYDAAAVARGAPYDLVTANILARPLCALAVGLAGALCPDGRAVLSGLLVRQEPLVLAAHRAAGLRLKARWRLGDWSTLVVGR